MSFWTLVAIGCFIASVVVVSFGHVSLAIYLALVWIGLNQNLNALASANVAVAAAKYKRPF